MSLTLRRLTKADAGALRALRLEATAAHPRDFITTPQEEAARPLAELAALIERQTVLGLFDGDSLVGTASLHVEPRAKLAHKGEIRGVYVSPAWRGRGGAARLLRALIAEAEGRLERVSLGVSEGDGPALRLYTRLGFALRATEPDALRLADGTSVAELTLDRRL